jgi:hypothetical protein
VDPRPPHELWLFAWDPSPAQTTGMRCGEEAPVR